MMKTKVYYAVEVVLAGDIVFFGGMSNGTLIWSDDKMCVLYEDDTHLEALKNLYTKPRRTSDLDKFLVSCGKPVKNHNVVSARIIQITLQESTMAHGGFVSGSIAPIVDGQG